MSNETAAILFVLAMVALLLLCKLYIDSLEE
jgi:hypothetical protein